MKLPLVSILIPTYNRPEYLKKALESCFSQTLQDFEIVITDNSIDNQTENLIQTINHPSIRYHKNEKNIGGFNNFEKSLSLAQGKYIKYLMDDDVLMPECLEKMTAAAENHPGVGIVMAPLAIIDQNDIRVHPVFYLVKKMNYLYAYKKTSGVITGRNVLFDFLTNLYPCCVPTGILFRKQCFDRLGSFDMNAKFAIDVEICMRFALEYDFYYINEALSAWRFNQNSDTVQLHNQGLDNVVFYNITEKILSDNRTKPLFFDLKWEKLVRKSYLFATKRCLLSILSGIKTLNFNTIFNTLKTILKKDPFVFHVFLLPFIAFWEVFKGLKSWFGNGELRDSEIK